MLLPSNKPRGLTNREPQSSVPQVGIEGLPGHARLHRHIKVLLVEIQNLLHVPQTEAHTTLRAGGEQVLKV